MLTTILLFNFRKKIYFTLKEQTRIQFLLRLSHIESEENIWRTFPKFKIITRWRNLVWRHWIYFVFNGLTRKCKTLWHDISKWRAVSQIWKIFFVQIKMFRAKVRMTVGRIFRNLLILQLVSSFSTAVDISNSSVGHLKLDYSVIQATGKFCPGRDSCQSTGI